MSAPRCLVLGAGRIAGGFIAPLLRAAGWEVVLAGRDQGIIDAINEGKGLSLRITGQGDEHWIGGVAAVSLYDPALQKLVAEADLIATAITPGALEAAGRLLAPFLKERLDVPGSPVNVITFENHRRAPELLALGVMDACGPLAARIGRSLGIGGAAVWRAVSNREVTPDGIRFDANAIDECYVDAASLVDVAPLDGSVPGLELIRSFDDRMVEKLWIFNAGHAAAAYLGWHAGCVTLDEAMSREEIRDEVAAVVGEAQLGFEHYLSSRPGSVPIPARSTREILKIYSDPALSDPVTRVGRDPRRKLAAGDRLIGPAAACLDAGISPDALAGAAAAALAYAAPGDPQAANVQRELELLGPEEVISTMGTLDPGDALVRLISDRYRGRVTRSVAR